MSPESDASRKYNGFFGKPIETKRPKTVEENIYDGIWSSYLTIDAATNRWSLIGPGTNKLLATIKLNRTLLTDRVSEAVLGKIDATLTQLDLWHDRAKGFGMNTDEYDRSLAKYTNLREQYLNGESLELAIRPLMPPGYDHAAKDQVLTVQLPQTTQPSLQ